MIQNRNTKTSTYQPRVVVVASIIGIICALIVLLVSTILFGGTAKLNSSTSHGSTVAADELICDDTAASVMEKSWESKSRELEMRLVNLFGVAGKELEPENCDSMDCLNGSGWEIRAGSVKNSQLEGLLLTEAAEAPELDVGHRLSLQHRAHRLLAHPTSFRFGRGKDSGTGSATAESSFPQLSGSLGETVYARHSFMPAYRSSRWHRRPGRLK